VDYVRPECPVPAEVLGEKYPTWPHRDVLLQMFREAGRRYGLYERTLFNTCIEKIRPKADSYVVMHVPEHEEDGDGGVMLCDAVLAFPGNLIVLNEIEFPGEDDFGGYIGYSSFDRFDYTAAEGRTVLLYGHGAFTIENVRTLVEHRCRKVFVACRKRNICGMKMVSWLCDYLDSPVPGPVMVEAMQVIYDLVGFDVWSAHSVQTDARRSFVYINQKTVFGVTDVYFLAGYYGLMEVVVDEVKRLTRGCAHTKKKRKLECDVIVKAIGTSPSFKVDKMLGAKELVGLFVNGDPRISVQTNGMFVQARNFGGFSTGPSYASSIPVMVWFVDYPDDWFLIKDSMPHNPPGEKPCYVPGAAHLNATFMGIGMAVPALSQLTVPAGALKARKMQEAHPLEDFLGECRKEWESYIRYFRKHAMVDERPDPPYPYTEDMMRGYMDRATGKKSTQG